MSERLLVLMGQPRFNAAHDWAELADHWPAELAGRVEIASVDNGRLADRILGDGQQPQVIVPCMSSVPGAAIAAGSFGLVQQFGVGVEAIDIPAATAARVWVANMPGLNAVPVAEHAIALLLALARRLPEARDGFQPGRWGEPGGRSLAGATVAIVGVGAIGAAIATRLAAFDVHLVAVVRDPEHLRPSGGGRAGLPAMRVALVEDLAEVAATADAVIVAASHEPGRPPLVDRSVIAAMRPGALLVNIARGGLLDHEAALEAVLSGRLGGLGLDVFPEEPYPAAGPLLQHPRILGTAHAAALTSGYFADAAVRLGDAIARFIDGRPPLNVLNTLPGPQRGFQARDRPAG